MLVSPGVPILLGGPRHLQLARHQHTEGADDVDYVVLRRIQLQHVVERHQAEVAAVRVKQHHLLAAGAGDLAADIVKQRDHQVAVDTDGAGQVARLGDLGEDVIRELDHRLQRRDAAQHAAPLVGICPERQMVAMSLHHRQGHQTYTVQAFTASANWSPVSSSHRIIALLSSTVGLLDWALSIIGQTFST
jgi:hypothetical protein